MNVFEALYDESEVTQVRFIGIHSDRNRYDFGIVYSNLFFGKPLVIDMQSGRSTLISSNDCDNIDWIKNTFNIRDHEEAERLAYFLQKNLPSLLMEAQY